MVVIGTRGSDLALTQSKTVALALQQAGFETRLDILRTQGDVVQDVALAKLEGKGFFTKELEEALLHHTIDIAVHSLKDLPTQSPPGLTLVAVPVREDARDVLLVAPHAWDPQAPLLPLKEGACVGTSAVRRKSQLLHVRADLKTRDLRGNVPTRIQKLREGLYDAIVLAQAGLNRLQWDTQGLECRVLSPMLFTPAPAQGALGVQIRVNDPRAEVFARALHHAETAAHAQAERALLARFEGGCHVPLGAYVTHGYGVYEMVAYLENSTFALGGKRVCVQGADLEVLVEKTYAALVDA
jgi:hydroxymethylbilane synthase